MLLSDLRVIVVKTDGAETQQPEQSYPDIRVPQVHPKQRRDDDGDNDHHAAHRRRSRLFLVGSGAFLPNMLPDLKLAQFPNQPGSDDYAKKKGGQTRERRPERYVPEEAESENLIEEPVEHDRVSIRGTSRAPSLRGCRVSL